MKKYLNCLLACFAIALISYCAYATNPTKNIVKRTVVPSLLKKGVPAPAAMEKFVLKLDQIYKPSYCKSGVVTNKVDNFISYHQEDPTNTTLLRYKLFPSKESAKKVWDHQIAKVKSFAKRKFINQKTKDFKTKIENNAIYYSNHETLLLYDNIIVLVFNVQTNFHCELTNKVRKKLDAAK